MEKHKKQQKPLIFIDASIYCEVIVNGIHHKICKEYLDDIGYKNKNLGLISIFALGEIFSVVFKNIAQDARIKALNLLEIMLSEQLETKAVRIKTIKNGDLRYIKEIRNIDKRVTYDDAILLSQAINLNSSSFVTIDKMFSLKENTTAIKNLQERFKLNIINLTD